MPKPTPKPIAPGELVSLAPTVIKNDRFPQLATVDGNPLLRQYLGSIDNPDLIVYRIRPNRVRYMQEWALSYYELREEDFR